MPAKIIKALFWGTCLSLTLILPCLAETIVIQGQQLIDKPTSYKNVTLDLTQGSFVVTNKATFELENTTLKGTISPLNPFLLKIISGKLILKNSHLTIHVQDIQATPLYPSKYYALLVNNAQVDLRGNDFTIDTPYTVGLLITSNVPTSGFIIQYNKISYFHGAFFLINSSQGLVSDNQFFRVSQSNIVTKGGENHVFRHNRMVLSGNNGVDILDSKHITLSNNHIFSSACYSILILRSQDLWIQNNYVTGGKTYAIYIAPSLGLNNIYDNHLSAFLEDKISFHEPKNADIHIFHNYLAQNRYGLTTNSVVNLSVVNNIFIQSFSNDAQRKFWTNNTILLKNTYPLRWDHNFYKEAFPQMVHMPLEKALKVVEFPGQGGVNL